MKICKIPPDASSSAQIVNSRFIGGPRSSDCQVYYISQHQLPNDFELHILTNDIFKKGTQAPRCSSVQAHNVGLYSRQVQGSKHPRQ